MTRKNYQIFYSLVAFLLLLSLSYSQASFAQQQRTVTGKVLSPDNTPLAGASVQVKGENISTTSDENGAFTLSVQKPVTVTISHVGYGSQDLYISTQRSVDITLRRNQNDLSDVVVVGYGTQNRRNVAASISKVSVRTSPTLFWLAGNILM